MEVAVRWLILACTMLMAAPMASATTLEIIPQPHQVTFTGSGFDASRVRTVVVTGALEDRFAAALLCDALREVEGLTVEIEVGNPPEGAAHSLSLSALSGATDYPPLPPSLHDKEGYGLRVSDRGIAIVAKTDAGLFYGVQTLIQLIEQSARERRPIPGMTILDWPVFDLRARYIEGAQQAGTVVLTRANLEREIKLLARYKINRLIIEIYNLAPFASFPYCADRTSLSLSDWEYLVELSHRYHVTIVPSLQSFGQIWQVIWGCDQGKPYREETAPGMICPSRPENLVFLQGLYRDLMRTFKYSPYVGIGCSEVRQYAWQDRYCPRCKARLDAGETYDDLYIGHVNNCAAAVTAAAREVGRPVRPVMWADEFYMGYGGKRWVGIDRADQSIVMGHWQYWSSEIGVPGYDRHDYDGIAGLLQRGYDVLFLSASFEFNTYLHDLSPDDPKEGKWSALLDSGIYNIAGQAKWAAVHGSSGYRGKLLGGGCATFSQHDIRCWDTTWYAYALQAEYSWGDPGRALAKLKDRFTGNFAGTFYGARTRKAADTIAAAYRDLDAAKSDLERNNYVIRDIIGEYDIHDEHYVNNDLSDSLKLIDDILTKPQLAGRKPADIYQRAASAQTVARSYRDKLAALYPEVRNTYSLGYLISAAHKIENHAKRTLVMLRVEEALLKVPSAKTSESRRTLELDLGDRCVRDLGALIVDTEIIKSECDQLTWNSCGYDKVIAFLEGLKQRVRSAAEQIRPITGPRAQ